MKFILASQNKHKANEIENILGDGFSIITMDETEARNIDIIEDGETFEENALIKARTVANATNLPTIADDSGICVDYLGGKPGIHTARFAGENATDDENIDKLLSELDGVPEENRGAHFACCIAVVFPSGDEQTFYGECHGRILTERHGENGFGYDPVFYVPEYGKAMAEIEPETKNKISHRSRALNAMMKGLTK
ncbi:MAG: XTP/dITP diphosphatase [Ruminococcaceae bacterium]|nr:XTP/dITP diphosphatase [Oscillospiraceae bacterium]